jgi:DNA-binding LytR/AlgR family response regulator
LAYVEVNGKHLYFNLTDGTVHEVFGTLREYEPLLLEQSEFMRIHRSYIVNMLQISELSASGVRTFSGKNLPVSRLLYPQLQKDYMKLLFSERED